MNYVVDKVKGGIKRGCAHFDTPSFTFETHFINNKYSTSPSPTCSLECALHHHPTFITQTPNMFPRMRTSSSPNIQQPTPNIGTKYFAKQ